MTPHSLAMNLENTADTLAEWVWDNKLGYADGSTGPVYILPELGEDTRKSLRRTVETLNMILAGDIRSPQEMAAEVEGRASE